MRENIGGTLADDGAHIALYSLKIADQRLDKKLRRAGLRAPDSLGKVRCPTIEEIVAIDHRNDDISEAHAFKRHRRGLGLTGVHVASGIARIDGAESAATCTRLSKDHDGGCAGAPALEDIRTARLGADRMKIETVEPFLYRLKARLVLSAGETNAEPIGFALRKVAHREDLAAWRGWGYGVSDERRERGRNEAPPSLAIGHRECRDANDTSPA